MVCSEARRLLAALCALALLGGGGAPAWGLEDDYKPDLENGRAVAADCMPCHDLTSGKKYNIGPYLWGIVGQKAGRVPGFKYTRRHLAKAEKIVWDEKTLDLYLKSPRGFIPGTSMAYVGVSGEKNRADLIAFLKTLK